MYIDICGQEEVYRLCTTCATDSCLQMTHLVVVDQHSTTSSEKNLLFPSRVHRTVHTPSVLTARSVDIATQNGRVRSIGQVVQSHVVGCS